MGKLSQASSQDKLRAFFREIVLGEPGVDVSLAERVAERCVRHIDLLLAWDSHRAEHKPETRAAPPPAAPLARAAETPVVPPLRASPPARPSSMRPFDPYAFSVVVTLVKKGRDALVARLTEIDNIEDLRQLANAQHLGVDPHLARVDDMRQAIVHGAEKRIAGRRAAAS
jgi:hypothetical protein